LTGIIGSHILKGPDPPRRGSDGPGLANILSHQIKVRAVVRYRAGYPIGKFGTVKQNRGPDVVRSAAKNVPQKKRNLAADATSAGMEGLIMINRRRSAAARSVPAPSNSLS
jgi:hypothetical protein